MNLNMSVCCHLHALFERPCKLCETILAVRLFNPKIIHRFFQRSHTLKSKVFGQIIHEYSFLSSSQKAKDVQGYFLKIDEYTYLYVV